MIDNDNDIIIVKKCKKINTSNIADNSFIPDYYIYTDGACSNNGKINAQAGIGIFFGIDDPRNVSQRIIGKQTNNIAELTAIIQTYYIVENDIISGKKIMIVTDSSYSIKCLTTYGKKCYDKNWEVDIPNKELVKKAYELYKDIKNVRFMYIKAHTSNNDIHSIGNEYADKLATMSISKESTISKKSTKIYINFPFNKKEEIKLLGGLWDSKKKKWYIYDNSKYKDKVLILFSQ